jgi:serine/threonine protein kinase
MLKFRPLSSYGEKVRELGRGTYGVVWLYEKDDKQYAVKKMELFEDDELWQSPLFEISSLKILGSHPYILPLIDASFSSTHIYMVVPYMKYGDLKSHLAKKELTDETKKKFAYQLLCGIGYMHSLDVLHLDLKPANILVDENMTLRIADFGLARALTCSKTRKEDSLVTLWWRAPEIALGGIFSSASDMWSIGCILYSIFTYKNFVQVETNNELIFEIAVRLGRPKEGEWPELQSFPRYNDALFLSTADPMSFSNMSVDQSTLVKSLLRWNPSHRATAVDCITTSYFDSVRVKKDEPIVRGCVENLDLQSRTYPQPSHDVSSLFTIRSWIREMTMQEFSLSIRIYFLASAYFALLAPLVSEDALLFIGAICFILASCFSLNAAVLKDIVSLLEDEGFTVPVVTKGVRDALRNLNFNLFLALPTDYIRIYSPFYPRSVIEMSYFICMLIDHVAPRPVKKNAVTSILLSCKFYRQTFQHTQLLDVDEARIIGIKQLQYAKSKFDVEDMPTFTFEVSTYTLPDIISHIEQ